MKNLLLLLLCITFIFSCEEKLNEGEYYETITIGDNYNTQRVKVIQIDTVYERSGDRYVGGWVNNYYFVGPYGEGTYITYEGEYGRKGTRNNHGYQGTGWVFNGNGDTTFKGEYKSTLRIRGRNGHGIETSVNRGSKYLWNQYVGEFKWDKKHGEGILTFSDGRVRDGLWEYGNFLGEETFDVELSKSKVVPESVQELCVLEIK